MLWKIWKLGDRFLGNYTFNVLNKNKRIVFYLNIIRKSKIKNFLSEFPGHFLIPVKFAFFRDFLKSPGFLADPGYFFESRDSYPEIFANSPGFMRNSLDSGFFGIFYLRDIPKIFISNVFGRFA